MKELTASEVSIVSGGGAPVVVYFAGGFLGGFVGTVATRVWDWGKSLFTDDEASTST